MRVCGLGTFSESDFDPYQNTNGLVPTKNEFLLYYMCVREKDFNFLF